VGALFVPGSGPQAAGDGKPKAEASPPRR
jgi:hypothetical protein